MPAIISHSHFFNFESTQNAALHLDNSNKTHCTEKFSQWCFDEKHICKTIIGSLHFEHLTLIANHFFELAFFTQKSETSASANKNQCFEKSVACVKTGLMISVIQELSSKLKSAVCVHVCAQKMF